jgi:hypothetical protein
MTIRLGFLAQIKILLFLALTVLASFRALAQESGPPAVLVHAARVFDGTGMRADGAVLVTSGMITQIGHRDAFKSIHAQVIDLGDATLLPGFIELHAHSGFQHLSADTILRHGVTTIRDVGGPVHPPYGGDGELRVLTSGPVITAPGGYPISEFGPESIAVAVTSEQHARETVRALVKGGAVVIKIALEPGGEAGAPWNSAHHHAHAEHESARCKLTRPKKAWPLLPENIVRAIVDEAHKQGRKVTAHIGEAKGARMAVNAGIDEWAHVPCDTIPVSLLREAARKHVKIVTTLDVLSKCSGVMRNAKAWAALGGGFLYGAEVAHPDIPWGIDAQELMYMMHAANMPALEALRSATSKAGRHLGLPLLGTLQPGAPADMIAVKGDPVHALKILEYPGFVMSGGKIVVNDFQKPLPGLQ